jgi:hypothetical protein
MKTVAEVIGVSRSNLADRLQERCKKRIGRPPLSDGFEIGCDNGERGCGLCLRSTAVIGKP